MRLRTDSKVIVAVFVVSLLLLLAGVAGAWQVYRAQRGVTELLGVDVASIRAAEELELQVREVRNEVNHYLLSDDASRLEAALKLCRGTDTWRRQAEALANTDEERQFMAAVNRGMNRFSTELDQQARSDGPRRKAELAKLRSDVLTDEVLANARKYLDFNEQQLERSNRENQQTANRMALALTLLGTCGAAAGLVAGYGVARGIRRSIQQLSVPIRDVAGKLNQIGPVAVAAEPGIEDLQSAMQKVSADVSTVVEQLERSHREVLRADQFAAIGQLAAGLAHELRNPLMSIKVLVQTARRGGQQKRLDERDLQVLDEEIARMESLLQSFLDFARPAQLQTQDVDLRDTLGQVLRLLARRAERQRVSLVQQVDGPARVEADAAQIRQVLLNLLLNALDATRPGGTIWVSLQTESALDGNGRADVAEALLLTVADNGKGLPAGHGKRIFEPFFSTKETGLGLGLAICKRIVESHGGTIEAGDRPEGGAVFTARLPRSVGRFAAAACAARGP